MVKQLNRKAIKQMEKKAREEMLKNVKSLPESEQHTITFNEWYAVREPMIPTRHKKEILQADFIGRGLKNKATMFDFDRALARYGVKLQ